MTRVLVTGGSGFIGSHLVEMLLEQGHQVIVLDRRVPKSDGVEWVDGDLTWIGDCDRAVRSAEIVFHLAARISVDESIDYVRQYFSDNLLATINILEACRRQDVRRFIMTSSCEVYGDVQTEKADENHPCNPTSPYAASKYAAERAAIAYAKTYGLPATIIRPFNCFGERQKAFRAGSAIPTFILLALQGRDIVIHGDGKQTRDFLYVKDVAEAHLLAMEKDKSDVSIFNIASGVERSIAHIAERVLSHIGNSKVVFANDPRAGAQLRRSVGDSLKARSLLGWQPAWDFDLALRRVIDFFLRDLKAALRKGPSIS